jgi:hypothetical protein
MKEEGAAMTIEIHRPELEALIRERMKIGGFQNPEDALMQALKSSPLTTAKESTPADEIAAPTGAALVAAMQASPYKDMSLEPTRGPMPVRDVAF